MRILKKHEWVEAPLDYFAGPNDMEIFPLVWLKCAPISGLYFEQPFDVRRVYEYVKDVGPFAVALKIRSRLSERARNHKFISCGIGSVRQPASQRPTLQDLKIFIAPTHPLAIDRIVLPEKLVSPASRIPKMATTGKFHFADWPGPAPGPGILDWGGWDPESGIENAPPLSENEAQAIHAAIDATQDWRTLEIPPRQIRTKTPKSGKSSKSKPTASLFGLGQYAKVAIIPNIKDSIELETIHEIDPLQMDGARGAKVQLDTCPILRRDEHPDAVFVASYHHHHGPLAVQALERGAAAVIEKPIATTRQQSKALLEAKQAYEGRIFPGFHKRYAKTNDWLQLDLGGFGENIKDMHCVVYEVALPDRHWYRWPNSGSRLLSNGCHWLDHFLFVNKFPGVADHNVTMMNASTIAINATLQNGACFTMTLTDRGPDRVGLREYVEIRTESRLATITNGHLYRAESSRRALRSATVPRAQSYSRMYSKISRAIANGMPGDDHQMLEQSMNLVITLEEVLQQVSTVETA